jgi:flagellar biosynthetic protein FliQ
MVDDVMLDFVRTALILALKIALPILGSGVAIGLVISIFQSITSIQEQTLTFVPKIFCMILVTIFLLSWIAARLAEYCAAMLSLEPV